MHKNLYKAGFGYSWLSIRYNENMNFAEYQMSHKGAAGKAFSAHMPIYIAFFRLTSTYESVTLKLDYC